MIANSRAFTLVEMLVVVVLISVLAGSVMVTFQGRSERYAVDAAAKDLAAAATFAAEQAQERGETFRIAFDPKRSMFRVERAAAGQSDRFANVDGIAGQKRYLSTDVLVFEREVAGAEPRTVRDELVFTPSGGGFSGMLDVVSQKTGYRAQLEILPHTRQVRVVTPKS